MCTVSNIGDEWARTAPDRWPQIFPTTTPTQPNNMPIVQIPQFTITSITREEFEALKKELEALKQVLIKAKLYDEVTGQKDCEMEEKVALFKRLAELTGVDLSEVFKS